MKNGVDKAFRYGEIVKWIVVIISVVLANWLYGDYRIGLFVCVATILSHELPTLLVGIYITVMLKRRAKV